MTAQVQIPSDRRDTVVAAADQEELTAVFERYLEDIHCTMWGHAFEIITPAGRNRAARFLTQTVTEALT